ncbi:probable isocitrate dehydrogenase [NAD] subunit beta, mitochondrial [Choristoneura fumiferana]|uniref:probable isocitrate dehydrogenase [NAD] subunit beta, mitochondrial n=1 Tax=Choristoneura fumiferana TaxID=7141 RepID=UPI003D15776C
MVQCTRNASNRQKWKHIAKRAVLEKVCNPPNISPCAFLCVCVQAAGIPVDFESYFFSEVNPTLSAPLEDVVNSIARNKICIKGILATPDFSHTGELQTLNMKLRNALDLYANVVHVKSLPNVNCRHKDVDCIIIREQTEGEYSALEHESVPETTTTQLHQSDRSLDGRQMSY